MNSIRLGILSWFVVSLVVAMGLARQATAATYVWDGGTGGTGTDLGQSANWNPDGIPDGASSDTLQWNGTVAGVLSLSYATATNLGNAPGVSFDITAGQSSALTLDGTVAGGLRLGSNGVSIASGAGAVTFGNGSGTFNITAYSGTIPLLNNAGSTATLGSDITLASSSAAATTWAFDGSGNWTVNGNLNSTNNTFANNVAKAGAGVLTITGGSTYKGSTWVRRGTLTLSGSAKSHNSYTTGGGYYVIDNLASTNSAILNISTDVQTYRIWLGDKAGSGQCGAAYQTAGTVTLGQGAGLDDLRIGSCAGGNGYYKLSGGTLTVNEVGVGASQNGTVGVMDMTGGTFTDNGYVCIGRGGTTSSGLLNLSGGTATASRVEIDWAGSAGAISILNVGGGAVPAQLTTTAATAQGLGLANANNAGTLGIANLLTNGTLITGVVKAWAYANPTTALNFNGGTLKANIANDSFMTDTGIDYVNVYPNGGTIDNGGFNITISRPLSAPAGNGVTSITGPATQGSGYAGAPLVILTNGATYTVPATAYAVMADDGTGNGTYKVDSVVVTSPGIYTVAPTAVTFVGGGSSAAADGSSSSCTINSASNTSGGMTFTGAGMTTLSGANTYSGQTTVSNGILAVYNTLPGSAVVMAANTTLLVTNTTFGSSLSLGANAQLTLTNGVAGGTLVVSNGLSLSDGDILNLDLGSTLDHVVVAGGSFTNQGNVTIRLNGLLGYVAGTNAVITTSGGEITSTNGFILDAGAVAGATAQLIADGGSLKLVVTPLAAVTLWWKGDVDTAWNTVSAGNYNWDTDQSSGIDAGALPSLLANLHFTANGAANFGTVLGQDFTVSSLAFHTNGVSISGANALVVNNGISSVAGGGTNTISVNALTLGTDQTWSNVANNVLAVPTAINGAGRLTKAGAGVLTLGGSNTHSGATTLNAGTLQINGTNALSGASVLTLSNGTTLALCSDADGTFTPASLGAFTSGSTYTFTVNSINSPAGDGHTLTLNGQTGGSYNANTTVNVSSTTGDTLKFGASAAYALSGNSGSAWSGNINYFNLSNANVILNGLNDAAGNSDVYLQLSGVSPGDTLTVNGTVACNPARTIGAVVNSGTLTLSNNVTGSSANWGFWVMLNGGTLNVNRATAINNNAAIGGAGNRAGFVINGGTLDNTSGTAVTLTVNPTIAFYGDFTFAGSYDLNLGAGAVTNGGNRTVTVSAKTLTIGGAISGAGNGLTKTGAGTLVLGGANSFTGATTVSNGTLVVNGSLATNSAVTVTSGTLTGTGTVNGVVTTLAGATLQPGLNGVGSMTLGQTPVLSGGTWVASLTTNGTATAFSVSGSLAVSSMAFQLSNPTNLNKSVSSYTIATATNVTGRFQSHNLPPGWGVQYGSTNITLVQQPVGTMLIVQ